MSIPPHGCPLLFLPSHILSSSTQISLPPKFTPTSISPSDIPQSHVSPWIDSPRYTPQFSTFYLKIYCRLDSIFEWILPTRVEVIYFLECAFLIGDLNCMPLLGNVHVLCITTSEFRLILLTILFQDFENWHKGFRTVWGMYVTNLGNTLV
jgi:hypothetical protein